MIAAVADTHTLIWYMFGSEALSEKARVFIDQAAHDGHPQLLQ